MTADIDWHTEQRKLADLTEWPKNPRQLSDRDAEEIKRSIARFGLADPLVINADDQIIGGHQRKRIMLLMERYGNDALIDVRIPSRQLTEREAEELAIRLNREFDLDDLLGWGFTEYDFSIQPFGDTSTERDGQGVSSTWDQVNSAAAGKVVIDDIETRLPVDVIETLRNLLIEEFEKHNRPIYETLEAVIVGGIRTFEIGDH